MIIAPVWIEHSNLGCIDSSRRYSRTVYNCSGTFYYAINLFFSGIFFGIVPVAIGIAQFFFKDGIPLKNGSRLTPKLHALILTLLIPGFIVRYQGTKKEIAAKLQQRLEQSE